MRVTIGHVQRGGAPSAFDRYMSTLIGYAAVEQLLSSPPGSEPQLIGMKDNRVTRQPLMACVDETRKVAECVKTGDYKGAMALRGRGVRLRARHAAHDRARPARPLEGQERFRFAIMHGGGPAPGINTAVRAALRLTLDRGHHVVGVRNAFRGLVDGDFFEMGWMSVNGWASRGEPSSARTARPRRPRALHDRPPDREARHRRNPDDGRRLVFGFVAVADFLQDEHVRERFPAFNLPIVLPA